jgi:octaprenyl-diphosphate synthase
MSATAGFTRPVPPVLRDIQAPVHAELERAGEELARIVVADFPLIADVKDHLMAMRGKMFRPTLVLLASGVAGRRSPRAVTLAAVVELVHLATLVHDDAVDHSALRRGMPTINALFSHQISVIMGDYLYSRGLAELVEGDDYEPLRVLTRATIAMTVGEMRQLTAVEALAFSEADYDELIRSKTASLISGACEVGALSGAEAYREPLSRYGARLGMVFQIADDLLDYTEVQEVTGKPAGLDLREHKVTLPLIAALREMPASARGRVDALFATPEPDERVIAEVVGIVGEYGGLDYARRRGEVFAEEAEEALGSLPETPERAALYDAIEYVLDRRS